MSRGDTSIETALDLHVREEGAFLFFGQGIAVDFEDATRERFELLGGNLDHAAVVAPLDDRETVGFVFEHDPRVGSSHGAERATRFFRRNESSRFPGGVSGLIGHETNLCGALDERKSCGIYDS